MLQQADAFKAALKENTEILRNKENELKKLKEDLNNARRDNTSLKGQLGDARDSITVFKERYFYGMF